MIWWLLFMTWLLLQIPFLLQLNNRIAPLRDYPMRVKLLMLVPFSRRWRKVVETKQMARVERARKFLLTYYLGVFFGPVAVMLAVMWIIHIRALLADAQ